MNRNPLAILLCAVACAKAPAAPSTVARYDPAAALQRHDFFALPFPSDLRRTSGMIDLAGFPNPERSALLSDYEVALREQTGWGGSSTLYVGFSGPIDPASLPQDVPATLGAQSAVQLVDTVTGDRFPFTLKWLATATLFLPANTLAILPLHGAPLHAGHAHALVLTDALKDAAGKSIGADVAMRAALADGSLGHFDAHTILASVFTVQDPSITMKALRGAVRATAEPAPLSAFPLQYDAPPPGSSRSYHLFEGRFPVPDFQSGQPPYLSSGGKLVVDASGVPQVQRTEQVRFALSLPTGAPPAGGFPAVIYSHGTGGSYLSFHSEGLAADLAARGVAMISMDQVLHGPRNPSCDETASNYEACTGTAYFNFASPFAGRDNTRQGAADNFQLLRMAKTIAVPASLHPEGLAASFDPARLGFLGHSQGGLTGSPFVSAEPELRAVVLSGTGGLLAVTVLVRKDPIDFKSVAELLLGIDGKESLEPFHPALAVMQTFGEPADPISYGPSFVLAPPGPRSFLLNEGLLDPYTSPDASEALGASGGFDIGGAASHQSDAFTARGLHVLALPLSGNLPNGQTAALLQYPNDGHFAIFDNPVARCRWATFLDTALHGGVGRVDPCGG